MGTSSPLPQEVSTTNYWYYLGGILFLGIGVARGFRRMNNKLEAEAKRGLHKPLAACKEYDRPITAEERAKGFRFAVKSLLFGTILCCGSGYAGVHYVKSTMGVQTWRQFRERMDEKGIIEHDRIQKVFTPISSWGPTLEAAGLKPSKKSYATSSSETDTSNSESKNDLGLSSEEMKEWDAWFTSNDSVKDDSKDTADTKDTVDPK